MVPHQRFSSMRESDVAATTGVVGASPSASRRDASSVGRSPAHVHDERRRRIGRTAPVEVRWQFAGPRVSGDETHRLGMIAMGQRHAERRRHRGSRGNARHDRNRDAGAIETCDLLAGAAEDRRIARLQANDMLALPCQLDHQVVDVVLRAALAPTALADQHALGLATREFEDGVGHQVVVEDDVGRLQHARSPSASAVRDRPARRRPG